MLSDNSQINKINKLGHYLAQKVYLTRIGLLQGKTFRPFQNKVSRKKSLSNAIRAIQLCRHNPRNKITNSKKIELKAVRSIVV